MYYISSYRTTFPTEHTCLQRQAWRSADAGIKVWCDERVPEPRAQLSVVGWRRGQVVTGAWCRMVKLSSPSPPLYCTLHLYTTVHTLGAGIWDKVGIIAMLVSKWRLWCLHDNTQLSDFLLTKLPPIWFPELNELIFNKSDVGLLVAAGIWVRGWKQ